MASNAQQNQSQSSGLHPLASFFLASGGAVVGSDYANWLEVDPVVGAAIGGVVSLVILHIAYQIHKDPNGEIRKGFMQLGFFVGAILGLTVAAENSNEDFAWLIGGFIGGVAGAFAGQMVAAIISLVAFAVLFLSQGPVGMAVRAFILNAN